MQIHDLNTKALTNPAYVAFDDGEDTYKTEFNDCVENAANAAVAAADLTENEVAFTSGDAASPTAWTDVSVITTGSTLATLFNRISTMVKNVRWLYSKLGTTDISSIGGGTVTGAISELNSKISNRTSASVASGYTGGVSYSVVGYMVVVSGWLSAAAASVGTNLVTGLPMPFISSANALIMANNNNAVNSTKRLTLSDHGEIRAGEELSNVNLRFTFAYIKV